TYPTYNGAIGMTYEQGGSGWAGLAITTNGGDTLTLKDRISHHLITGLSTLEVTSKNVDRLNQEFKKYYQLKNYDYHAYVLNGKHDNLVALTKLLEQHEIEFGVGHTDNVKGFNYSTGKNGSMQADTNSIVVSTQQKKGTLVKVLFEPDAKLSDSLTYDITAWSLPYAYGLQAIAVESMVPVKGKKSSQEFASSGKFKTSQITNEKGAYAFLTNWASMEDAKFLADLLKAGIKVRYAKKPFIMDGTRYDRGTLIIARADNKHTADFLVELDAIATLHRKPLSATSTGFVEGGKDFGSDSVQLIDDVNVAVLSGEPTATLQFGEIWHFFEQQIHYPLSTIDTEYFEQLDLSEYDVLILPDGEGYNKFMDKNILNDLKDWVKKGGKLIAMGGALKGLAGEKKGFHLNTKEIGQDSSLYLPVYDETRRQQIKKAITGAIFKAQVDNTHPLAYGYDETYFTLKLGNDAYSLLDEGTVVYLGEDDTKPIAGFAGSMAQEKINETLIFGVEKLGEGHIIYMVDNPLFRGFWENGKLFFANALFLVN
ncbi:MAG: zinc carboxypeptidase, partial [Pricia sp.]|nr:zinc carboxypeptidase [Pricia sp.]